MFRCLFRISKYDIRGFELCIIPLSLTLKFIIQFSWNELKESHELIICKTSPVFRGKRWPRPPPQPSSPRWRGCREWPELGVRNPRSSCCCWTRTLTEVNHQLNMLRSALIVTNLSGYARTKQTLSAVYKRPPHLQKQTQLHVAPASAWRDYSSQWCLCLNWKNVSFPDQLIGWINIYLYESIYKCKINSLTVIIY